MKSFRSRGFTLIELLVVIAIIGLLASIILASLNTAQQKGRDATRVSDMQEMANAIALISTGGSSTNFTCTGTTVNTCTIPNLASYADPSVGASGTACSASSAAPCQFSIAQATAGTLGTPTTQQYEICTYLEAGSGNYTGKISISATSTGNIVEGCN